MILISACLAGQDVRYDGGNCLKQLIKELVEEQKAVSICPEVSGGLSTPREPAEIIGGDGYDVLDGKAKVMDRTGKDVTEMYVKGAYATLKRAKEVKAELVVLKERSPSCGSSMIYNGHFDGNTIAGNGVTAALLKRNGFKVISDEEFVGK